MSTPQAAPMREPGTPTPTPSAAGGPPPPAPQRRRRLLLGVAGIVLLAGLAYGVHWFLTGRNVEGTDNAYVAGSLVQVTPQIAGTVRAIRADDTDFVKAGQPLVELDAADAQVAVGQAEAQLGQTVREVRTLYATNGALNAGVTVRETDVLRARSVLARATDDLQRRQALGASGAVSDEELKHAATAVDDARSALAATQAAVAAAREQLAANVALTRGAEVETHPNVQRAAAAVREAYLNLARTTLVAPVSGHIARRSVQLGARVAAGAPLMAIVPLDRVWVEANFKEGQLARVRIGQPVKLEADLYGSKVVYDGHIEGVAAGTGSAFSLLPAQNATGNWIKVVQRVPVRVQLDPQQIAAHPLRVGLSMVATVDVSDTRGKVLADAPRVQPQEAVAGSFDATAQAVDQRIGAIIAASLGGAPLAAAHGLVPPPPHVPVAATTAGVMTSAATSAAH